MNVGDNIIQPETPALDDFTVTNHGSIFTLTPVSEDAQAWVEENLPGDDVQWFGGAVVVEHRYIGNIVEGIQCDGLTVSED